jgi:predicted Zn-dependent protease
MQYTIQLKAATSYYNIGQYANAENLLQQAVATKKRNVAPYLLLSAIQIQNNDYDKALQNIKGSHTLILTIPEILYHWD